MVIELSVGGLLTLLGIPTAITSLGLWLLQRRISKREAVQDAREAAREQNEVLLIQNTRAALALRPPPWPSSASRMHIATGTCTPPLNTPAKSNMPKRIF